MLEDKRAENNGLCTAYTSTETTRTYAQWAATYLSNQANGIQALDIWGLAFHPSRYDLAASYEGFANWDNKPKVGVWNFNTTTSKLTAPQASFTGEYGLTNLDYVLNGKGLAVVKDTSTVNVLWPGLSFIPTTTCTGPSVSSWPLASLATSRGSPGNKIIHCGFAGAANIFNVVSDSDQATSYTCTLQRRIDSKRVDVCTLRDDRLAATADAATYE